MKSKALAFLLNIHIAGFIALAAGLMLLLNWTMGSLPFLNPGPGIQTVIDQNEMGRIASFFLIVIYGPAIETAIFQSLVLYLSSKLFRKMGVTSSIYPILTSALAFGLSHCYNLSYMILTLMIGFWLATCYVIVQKRKEFPFVVIFVVHGAHNLFLYLTPLLISD